MASDVPECGASIPNGSHNLLRERMAGMESGAPTKITPTNGNKNRKPVRFTPDDILRAIKGVEGAGLEVYAVEITSTGSIKIFTGPSSGAIAPLATTDAGVTSDGLLPKKKQA